MLMKAFEWELCVRPDGQCGRKLAGDLAGVKLFGQIAKGILGCAVCPDVLTVFIAILAIFLK